jgi:hypothetical protein
MGVEGINSRVALSHGGNESTPTRNFSLLCNKVLMQLGTNTEEAPVIATERIPQ